MYAIEIEIKDLRSVGYFLGTEIALSKKGIVISQQKCVLDLLKETGMSGCSITDRSQSETWRWQGRWSSVSTTQYQKLVGELIYLSQTWSNIAFCGLSNLVISSTIYLVIISIEWIRNKILLLPPKTYTHNTVIEEEEEEEFMDSCIGESESHV